MLEAKGTLVDTRLEPTDNSNYIITVKNKSNYFTARGVMAHIALVGGPVAGIEVSPDDRFFGDIKPKGCVSREINLNTERAPVGSQELSLKLSYTVPVDLWECERTPFQVVDD